MILLGHTYVRTCPYKPVVVWIISRFAIFYFCHCLITYVTPPLPRFVVPHDVTVSTFFAKIMWIVIGDLQNHVLKAQSDCFVRRFEGRFFYCFKYVHREQHQERFRSKKACDILDPYFCLLLKGFPLCYSFCLFFLQADALSNELRRTLMSYAAP